MGRFFFVIFVFNLRLLACGCEMMYNLKCKNGEKSALVDIGFKMDMYNNAV